MVNVGKIKPRYRGDTDIFTFKPNIIDSYKPDTSENRRKKAQMLMQNQRNKQSRL